MKVSERTSLLFDASKRAFGSTSRTNDASQETVGMDDLSDIYRDDPQSMTMGRRIAQRLSRYSWYRPREETVSSGSAHGASRLPNL